MPLFLENGQPLLLEDDSPILLQSEVSNEIGSGGILTSGAAEYQFITPRTAFATGSVTLGSLTQSGTTSLRYIAIGGITLQSIAPDPGTSFFVDLKLTWNTKASIQKDLVLLWNTGNLPIFWYRVIGKPKSGNECNLISDPCCKQFIMNIHARTLSELCEKLKSRNLGLPIERVQRFSRPAETSVIAAQQLAGIDHECNELQDVGNGQFEVCDIPACAELCVKYDLRSGYVGFNFVKVQVNGDLSYTGSGSVYISSRTLATRSGYESSYQSTGTLIISGSADCETEHVTSIGGVSLGGTAYAPFTNWSFVGGEWPSRVLDRIGSIAESVPFDGEDWAFPQQALVEDTNYTQVDVSYGRDSDFLVVRGFNLSIPQNYSVLGVVVELQGYATATDVVDLEAYLVRGDAVISENLAEIDIEWPTSPTIRLFGGNGLTQVSPWGSLSSADLSDPDFGFALRVGNLDNSSIARVRVNYVKINVYYEDPSHQCLRLYGEVATRSMSHHYSGNGAIYVSGKALIVANYRFTPSDPYVILSSLTSTNTLQITSGGATLGGEAYVTPVFEFGSGGVSTSGDAIVKPYLEPAYGGLIGAGSASLRNRITVSSQGALLASGSVVLSGGPIPSGGVRASGESVIVFSHHDHQSQGSVAITGEAFTKTSHLGTSFEVAELSSFVRDISVIFADSADVLVAQTLTSSNLAQCGCQDIPFVVNLQHNLAASNRFAQFLARNGLSMSSILRLSHNTINSSWQTNLHYRGFSAGGVGEERWDFVFDLQCSDVMGSIDLGTKIWKLAIDVFRRNLATSEDFNTRIVIGILPDAICKMFGQDLTFEANYDTQADFVVVDPNATIYQHSLYDNIGLFRSKYWIDNPDLRIKVSQSGLDADQTRIDLTESVFIS